MKVITTRRIVNKLIQIMHFKQASSVVNTIITNGIAANSFVPSDVKKLRQEAIMVQKEMPEYSINQIMMLLLVEALIGTYLEQQPEMMNFFMN